MWLWPSLPQSLPQQSPHCLFKGIIRALSTVTPSISCLLTCLSTTSGARPTWRKTADGDTADLDSAQPFSSSTFISVKSASSSSSGWFAGASSNSLVGHSVEKTSESSNVPKKTMVSFRGGGDFAALRISDPPVAAAANSDSATSSNRTVFVSFKGGGHSGSDSSSTNEGSSKLTGYAGGVIQSSAEGDGDAKLTVTAAYSGASDDGAMLFSTG
jgi:hypothetical protein